MRWLERCDERDQLIAEWQRTPEAEARYLASVRQRGDRAPWEEPAVALPVIGCLVALVAIARAGTGRLRGRRRSGPDVR